MSHAAAVQQPSGAASGEGVRRIGEALMALVPLLASVALYLPGGVLSPLRWAVLVVVALAAWQFLHGGNRRAALWCALPGVLVLLSGLLPVAAGQRPVHGGEFAEFAMAVAAAASGVLLGRTVRSVALLAWGWMVAAGLSAVVGAWELATGHHLRRYLAGQVYPRRYPGWNVIAAFQNNANLYAYLIVVALSMSPLAFATLGARAGRWRALRWLVPVLVVANLVMLNATLSRIGELAAAAVLFSWLCAWRRVAWPLFVVACIGLWGTWWGRWPGTHGLRRHLQAQVWNIQKPGDSGWVRYRLIRSGIELLQQTHGLGTGPGSFSARVVHSRWRPPGIVNPHCALVEIGAQYGLLALAAWLVGLAALVVWLLVRVRARRDGRWSVRCVTSRTLVVTAIMWPLLSMTHSTWMDQPLTCAHLLTMGVLVGALSAWRPGTSSASRLADRRARTPGRDTATDDHRAG